MGCETLMGPETMIVFCDYFAALQGCQLFLGQPIQGGLRLILLVHCGVIVPRDCYSYFHRSIICPPAPIPNRVRLEVRYFLPFAPGGFAPHLFLCGGGRNDLVAGVHFTERLP